MYKWILLLPALSFFTAASAQYYYTDVLSNRTSHNNFLQLKKAGVKTVLVSSLDPDGTPTPGFSVKQELNKSRNTIETTSQSAYSNPSVLLTQYSADGWPQAATDSTDASVAHITYTYSTDTAHLLTGIASSTTFPGERINAYTDVRTYQYRNGIPVSMTYIKNGKDITNVTFVPEEGGRIGEERWTKNGKLMETYYYYYDASGRLTDIAQYHRTARRILPVYTFEYDADGRITTMVTVLSGSNQYRTWRYTYDARGLKTGEVVYNKYRQQEGKLEYRYE